MAVKRTGQATFGISCGTSGATIRFTTDGSNPTTSSTAYTTKQTVKKNTTVKAIGIKSGLLNSEVATETITILLPKPVLGQSVNGDTGKITLTNASVYEDYNGVTYQIKRGSGSYTTVIFPYTVTANDTYTVKAVSAGENEDSAETSISISTLKVDTPVITVDA